MTRWWKRPKSVGFSVSVIRDAPRWLFLAALVYAPWHYGSTTSRSIANLNYILAAVIATWLLELAIRRRRPDIPFALLITAVAILSLGWFATFNARAVHDTEFGMFAPIQNLLPLAPSSVDGTIAGAWMLRATILIGILLFVADLSLRSHWLLRIWVTVGIAGGSIALLGLLQRSTGAVLPYWEYQPNEHSTFFATYYYHANAGAFLNLVFPLTVGLTLRAFQRPGAAIQRAVWMTAMLLLIAAIFTNTSRAAQLLGLITFIVLAMGPGRQVRRLGVAENRIALALTILVTVLVLFVIAQASGVTKGFERWQQATERIPKDARWDAYRVALLAVPDAGWSGFGPGTFSVVFPHYAQKYAIVSPGGWEFLHQDYLQTILEWGWAGSACWALIFFAGISAGIFTLNRLRTLKPAIRLSRVLPLILIALGAIAIHALVDFPLQVASLQLYVATYLGICWGSLNFLASARRAQIQ